MNVNETLIDVLRALTGGNIYRTKTKNSTNLSFEKYANISISAGQFEEKEDLKSNKNGVNDTSSGNSNVNSKLNHESSGTKSGEKIDLFIKTLTGKSMVFHHYLNDTIYEIKKKIHESEGIPINNIRLIVKDNNIIELENSKTISDYNISHQSVLYLVYKFRGEEATEFHIPDNLFDPSYDYDFTNINDRGKKIMRGGMEYKRPCGWRRFALKVLDKYNDTMWLGCVGNSNYGREWVVSYHGTKIYNAKPINENELKSKNQNVGVFCTPDITTAEKNAEIFTSPKTNRKYKVVFQNRVKPSSIIKCNSTEGSDVYWYIEDGKDVRPYSICIKEVK